LILVQEAKSCFLGKFQLVPSSVKHVAPPIVPDVVWGKIVAEDADVWRLKNLRELDGASKACQMRGKRLVNSDLADGRAERAHQNPVAIKERLQFSDLQVGQVKVVPLVDGTELDMQDAALFQDFYLPHRVGIDFIGEGAQDKHGSPG